MKYAETSDVFRGRRATALKDVPLNEIEDALTDASSLADSNFAGQYKLPLKSWDNSLRKHVANIAFYELMKDRGFRPGGGEYEICRQDFEDALTWFSRISRGAIHPPGFKDSTPDHDEYQVGIATSEPRGW